MQKQDWLTDRVTYLKGLKSPTEQQQILVLLAEKSDRTPQEEKKLATLVKAEKDSIRASKSKLAAANLLQAEKKAANEAERKARDHQLFKVAGLLGLAGLVDQKTGIPTLDRGELLGALMGLAKVAPDNPRRAEWKRDGDALLATTEKTKQ